MRKSLCILTFGHSHELKTVGAKQLAALYLPTSSSGKGTKGDFYHKVAKYSCKANEVWAPAGSEPRIKWIIYALHGQDKRKKLKPGSDVHNQPFVKHLLHGGLFLQPSLHPSLVRNSRRSMCSSSPLIPCVVGQVCIWKSSGTHTDEGSSTFWGVRAGPWVTCGGHWVSNDLWLIDLSDHSQIISLSCRSMILLSPDCCLGSTWKESSFPITSPGTSWKFLLSLEKCRHRGEPLAGCVQLIGTRRLTSSPFNDSGNVCLVVKSCACFCLCIATVGIGV